MKLLITYASRRIGEMEYRYFHSIDDSEITFLMETKKYYDHDPPLTIGEEYFVLHTVEITDEQAKELEHLV